MKRLTRIELPGIGTMRLDWEDDWNIGSTTYRVTAPRVSGSLEVTLGTYLPERALDVDNGSVHIAYGRGPRYLADHEREDRLTVNGIRLGGGSSVDTDIMRTRRLNQYDVNVRRGWRGDVPDATATRTAAVAHGVIGHWLTRPDGYVMRLAAVRHACGYLASRLAHDIARDQAAIDRKLEALAELKAQAAQAAANASMPPAL